MGGFSQVNGDSLGSVMNADNVSFDGTYRGGVVTTNGQLLIGSTIAPHIRVGTLTSTGGTIAITKGNGTINLEASSATTVQTLTGNSGGAISPSGGNINTVGTGSITTVGSGSTLTTQLTGLTNHSVLLGAGTATITSLTNGTTGQVLTAVTGADPVWAAPASSFTPNSVINLSDDFLGYTDESGLDSGVSNYSYTKFLNGAKRICATTSTITNPGILGNQDFGSGYLSLFLGEDLVSSTGQKAFIVGGGAISLNMVVKTATLSNVTNRYILRIGLGNTPGADQVNGIYFEYSDNINSGNWVAKTAKASTRSTANSAVAVVNSAFVNLGITINASATSCSFFVNGVEIANSPLTTNIPTAATTVFIDMVATAGTIADNSILWDLWYLTQTLTASR